MKLIVGLGNPGPKYAMTRHNVGFLAVDLLVDRFRAQGPNSKFKSQIFQAEHNGEKLILMKPETFMNVSGEAVSAAFKFYQLTASDLIVIYDDLDLKPFSLRLKTGGGAGGHNGIKSIDEHQGAGNLNYHKVRIGIGHPSAQGLNIDVAAYVLGQFQKNQWDDLSDCLNRACDAVESILKNGIQKAMTAFNQ